MKRTFVTRLLAILVCVATLATVTPIFAAAATTITKIEITDADVTPYIGEKAGDWLDYTLPENCHYTVAQHYWYNETVGGSVKADEVFAAGSKYDLCWRCEAESGYTFDASTTVTINGSTTLLDDYYTKVYDDDSTVFVVWTKQTEAVEKPAATVITKIEITDADVTPYIGEKAGDWSDYTLPANCHYTAKREYWHREGTDGGEVLSDDVFEEGVRYDRYWYFKADEGYIFDENAVITINGSTALVDTFFSRYYENEFSVWTKQTEAVENTVINKIEITDVDVLPIIGEKANDHIDYTFSENCHFTAAKHGWYDRTAYEWVDGADDTFVAGHIYQVGWWLDADWGYTFAEDPTITINGGENINWEYTYIDEEDSMRFYVWCEPKEAVEKPEPIETTVDLRIGDKEFYGVKGGETLVVESLDAMQDITVLVQNGVDIEGMSEDWSMSTKFLDSEGRGVLEVQVFEEGDDYVTFNLQSHYADCPGSSVDDFQIMMITVKVEASAEKLLGDANGDGAVNMKDVLALRKQLAGMSPEINLINADCNGDGDVNMKDVLMLRKFLAGLITELEARK